MKALLIALVFCLAGATQLQASQNYRLDETNLENMFAASEDVTSDMFYPMNNPFKQSTGLEKGNMEVAAYIAFGTFLVRLIPGAIGVVFPIVGLALSPIIIAAIFPWHRYYLGTDGEGVKISALYCVTWGWCWNIHHVVDGIMLLTDESASEKFQNNGKWIMWAK